MRIFLKLVYEEMYVFVEYHVQQMHLKEAEIHLIANASKTKKCAVPAQKSELDLTGSGKSLLLTLMIQPRFIQQPVPKPLVSSVIQPFLGVQRLLLALGERGKGRCGFATYGMQKTLNIF